MQDSRFMTAKEKELVLRVWERFLKSGLQEDKFTKSLYNHLIQHCNFIAHYDRAGFYNTYFADGDGKAFFLSQFDARNIQPGDFLPSREYGMEWRTGGYEDVNRAMVEVATTYIPLLLTEARIEQRDIDVAKASALLKRHGMEVK